MIFSAIIKSYHKMNNFVNQLLQTQIKLMDDLNQENIVEFSEHIIKAVNKNQSIFFLGNGGSAATASHICADFNRYLYSNGARRSTFYCMNDSISLLTSISNDLSYEDIYTEQLKGVLQTDDVIIAITGKGKSKNVLNAVDFGNNNGALTLALCGFDGGNILKSASHNIHVKSNDMQIVENMHLMILHIVLKNVIQKFQA